MRTALILIVESVLCILGAISPLVWCLFGRIEPLDAATLTFLILNGSGWCLAFLLFTRRHRMKKRLSNLGQPLGVQSEVGDVEALLESVIHEINRRDATSSLNILDSKIGSSSDLSRALERVAALTYKLFDAESVELALFDKESGLYHSSFVLGMPFRKSAQAMLSGVLDQKEEEANPGVLVHPVVFSGTTLGTLRAGLRRGRLPSTADRELIKLLALQAGLAILNAEYTSDLMRMKHTSEESVKAKTGFLANLSHEIRGPLGIMLNAVELVLDGLCGPVNEDQLETLKMVHSNGEHLLDLINDVLDFAKIEAGKVTPTRVPMRVNDLLKDMAGVVRAQSDAKNHSLNAQPCDPSWAISVDKRHIRQMMINLLTNAIKYTPHQGTIDLWAERTGGEIKICVRDTGVGIEESQRHKVFQAFERVEHSYSLAQMGTGLGMPLTKKLAEVNGGRIDFTSSVGKGSTFWLSFPETVIQDEHAIGTVQEAPEAEGRSEPILLVARDDGERDMITRYLSHIGFRVIPVISDAEALTALKAESVSLVLIDNNVVDRPENDVVSAIRESAKAHSLPVILLTSRAFVFDIEKYLKGGIDRCLIKPVELKDLGRICRSLIDGTYSGAIVDEAELSLAKNSSTNISRAGYEASDTKLIPEDETTDKTLH